MIGEVDREITEINRNIKFMKKIAWILVVGGILLMFLGVYKWVFSDKDFNEVGDYIGGVSGSLWALAGLFFIYIAFLGQKIEIKNQQKELALNRKELELSREELKESRIVFKAQADIMLDQKLDATFFNLLDNHRKVVDSFKAKERVNQTIVLEYGEEYDTKVISGYEALENIYGRLKWYLKEYSKFLKSRNIFEPRITNSNPIKEIKQYQDIEILYNEVSGIVEFILQRIRKENQEFYLKTLFNNLSNQEKFLLSAYNINCSDNFLEVLNFENYLKYNLIRFSREEYFIKDKLVYAKRVIIDSKVDFVVKFDDIDNYSELDLYYINKKEKAIELITSFSDFKKEIYLLDDLKKILDNKFASFKQVVNVHKDLEFKILLRGVHVDFNYRIFDFLEVSVSHNIEHYFKFKFSLDRYSGVTIDNWIQDHFNNLEN